jgi:hypothetical protein
VLMVTARGDPREYRYEGRTDVLKLKEVVA